MRTLLFAVAVVALSFTSSAYGDECLPGTTDIHRGDVNCSGGEPNVTDVIQLNEFINDWDPNFDPIPCCFAVADVNGDAFITNLDVVALISYLYNGGSVAFPHCPCSL